MKKSFKIKYYNWGYVAGGDYNSVKKAFALAVDAGNRVEAVFSDKNYIIVKRNFEVYKQALGV